MPLSESQAKRVRALAEQRGVDPEKALARAEQMLAKRGKAPDAKPAAAPADKPDTGALPITVREGFFAYQFPALRVNEIRASLGQPPIPDGDLFYNEWLAKHGGAAGGGEPVA